MRSPSPPRSTPASRAAAPAARRHPDPRQGQHRHRRRQHTTAGSLALAEARAKRDATVVGAAAAGRRGHPRQGQPDRIRQHPGDRHAGRLQLAGRPGQEPLRAAARRARRADRLARRVELGLGGGGRGRAGGGGDRHRDLGLAAVAGLPERPGHGQADGRAHQPRRHHPDRAQPGHRRPVDPHRARRGDPARTCWPPPTRSTRRRGDLQRPADYTELARRRRAARRADRRAERSRRPGERCLLRPAAGRAPPRSWRRRSRSSRRWGRRSCAPICRPRAGSAAPAPRSRSSTAIPKARPCTSRCAGRSSSSTS